MSQSGAAIRDARRTHFFMIDNVVIQDYLKVIGPHAFSVYSVLVQHSRSNTARLKIATIAKIAGISDSTVKRSIRMLAGSDGPPKHERTSTGEMVEIQYSENDDLRSSLEKAGLPPMIQVNYQHDKSSGHRTASEYVILDISTRVTQTNPDQQGVTQTLREGVLEVTQTPRVGGQGVTQTSLEQDNIENNEKENKNTPNPSRGSGESASDSVNADQSDKPARKRRKAGDLTEEQQARFDRWYATYPKKEAKQAALRKWKTIDPDDDLVDQMIAAVSWQSRDKGWDRPENYQYIPQPSRWLNEERWEDVPPPTASATNTGDPFEEIRVGGMKIQRGVVEQAKRKFDWYSAAVDAGFMGVTQEHVKAMQSGGRLVEVFPRDIAVQINRKLIHHIRQFDAVSRV